MAGGNPDFVNLFNDEFKALTDIEITIVFVITKQIRLILRTSAIMTTFSIVVYH